MTTTSNYDEEWDEEAMSTAEKLGAKPQDIQQTWKDWDTIQSACVDYGLNDAPGCIGDALHLADKYSMDWLLKAMKLSRDARMKWRFVETTLARWQAEGGPESYEKNHSGQRDDPKGRSRTHGGSRRKSDAELDEELKRWGVNLND